MARPMIPEQHMTEVQLRKRESNRRYQEKLKGESTLRLVTEQEEPKTIKSEKIVVVTASKSGIDLTSWRGFSVVVERPSVLILGLAVAAITSLLIVFQAQAYLSESMGSMAWVIATTCELSLVALTIMHSTGNYRVLSILLFAAMMVYTLGVMSYDLKSSESKEVTTKTTTTETITNLKQQLEYLKPGLELSISRKEAGNIKHYSNKISEVTKQLNDELSRPIQSTIIEAKYSGLIFLRGILMIINALFVVQLIRIISNTMIKQKG